MGWSGSGKTTVIERLIPALAKIGIPRVAVIKHSHHRLTDTPGKDTDRLQRAGATVVGLVGEDGYLLRCQYALPREGLEGLMTLLPTLGPFDLVLLEGFKRRPGPKIEVVRRGVSVELISSPEELLAVIGDVPPPAGIPWVRFGEEERLAVIVKKWLNRPEGGGQART
ncbi:MAG: molybdopterin-guanine dinucleotide biosynthesis protein B [Moorellales bacterium]